MDDWAKRISVQLHYILGWHIVVCRPGGPAMTFNRSFMYITLLAIALIPALTFAQCPYTQPTFNKDQVQQLCDERKQQQDALTTRFGKVKVEMITVQAKNKHHVGNIYAVLVGGAPTIGGSSGGTLVPILPANGPST